ncbi:hypothetical protein C8J57DRAFT_1504992 [Mycena rebaudengoi]|nr:hypothetical protein C8J57DRAFT_1504992 [Mycena rebaudengoi]
MSVETFTFALWTLPEAVINVHDGSGVQAVSFHGEELLASPESLIIANTSSSNVYHAPSSTKSSLTTNSLASFDIINSASIVSSTFELVKPCADSHGADQVAVEAFLQAGQPYPRDDGVQAEQQQRWWSLGEQPRASTKAECAPPNIVGSPAWLKHLCGDSASGTKLRPRLNVLRQTLWSLQPGSKISAELRRDAQSFDQG